MGSTVLRKRPHAGTASRASQHTKPRRILASKLSAPRVRPGIIDRPLLTEALVSPACAPLVLLSAPAGYGKTTLLALWCERDERPFAWVSLEGTDNDPVSLVTSIVAALRNVLELDAVINDALNVPEPPLEDVVLPLVDACTRCQQRFTLVLDDLHMVTDRRSHAVIRYLAERLSPGSQLALATRTDPPLPLASWRAHGRLAEFRAAQLSLDLDETRAMLAAAGVPLKDELVAQLVQRTEGWPAALYLAALSLRDRAEPEEFVERFAGASRHVADFLSEDVLDRQSDVLVDFMLHTCVLEELSAPLCDAVSGGADAAAHLRELERSNLFVVLLDEERSTYRYHHLFAQNLRAELAHRMPNLMPELHGRASRWYREQRIIGRAVAHAQAAGEVMDAANLVAAQWLPMVESGKVETVRAWIAGFDDRTIEDHAPLAIATAWVAALAGDQERALQCAEVAQRGSWNWPMPDGTVSLESALAIMSSAFGLGGASGMLEAAKRAVELESRANGWRALALMLLGVAQTLEGEVESARKSLDEAVHLSRGETATGTTSLAYLALIDLLEGHETKAFRHAQRALAVVERPGMRNYMPSICTYAIVAHLQWRRGELDAAAVTCERVSALLPRLTEAYWWQMIETRILLAPVLAARGCDEQAATYLRDAAVLLAERIDAGKLHEWHIEAERKLGAGNYANSNSRALSDAEWRILRLLASNLTLREIGSELRLSMNTVRTHKRSIYRKLGVSSRMDAIRAAHIARRAAQPASPG